MLNSLPIQTGELIHWFNALRNLPPDQRGRALDALWAGQIDSKVWLVETLNNYVDRPANIYIFGGWIGILANILFGNAKYPINKIRSIDIDPWCERVADDVNKLHEMNDWRFKGVTACMAEYQYQSDLAPTVVINTSTEHVDQSTYNTWWHNIPAGTLVVVQGNNYFDCSEHVRCSKNLQEFAEMNWAINPVYLGSLPHDLYTRYMAIFVKN